MKFRHLLALFITAVFVPLMALAAAPEDHPAVKYGVEPGHSYEQAVQKLKDAGFVVDLSADGPKIQGMGIQHREMDVVAENLRTSQHVYSEISFFRFSGEIGNFRKMNDKITLYVANSGQDMAQMPVFRVSFQRIMDANTQDGAWLTSDVKADIQSLFGGAGPCKTYTYYYDGDWISQEIPSYFPHGQCSSNMQPFMTYDWVHKFAGQLEKSGVVKYRTDVSWWGKKTIEYWRIDTVDLVLLHSEIEKSMDYWRSTMVPTKKIDGTKDF